MNSKITMLGLAAALCLGCNSAAAHAQEAEPQVTAQGEENLGTANFLRTTLVIPDMAASMAFWGDVMGFALVQKPRTLPPAADLALGWTADAQVTFARFQSDEGAGVGLLEVHQDGFPNIAGTPGIAAHPTGMGGVVLVFTAKDIEAIYERALAAGVVHTPLERPAGQGYLILHLKSPGGYILELYESRASAEDE